MPGRFRIIIALCLSLALALCSAVMPPRASAQFSFTPLGDLPGGDFASYAYAVSADGSVVVGASASQNPLEAFRWTAATGMVGLGDLRGGGGRSRAFGVSHDGSVIVGDSMWHTPPGVIGYGPQAFRWSTQDGMIGLGTLPIAPAGSSAVAASLGGSVVVGYSGIGFETYPVAFRWTATEGLIEVGDRPRGGNSGATDVSADGDVVIGWISPSGSHSQAFRWTADTGTTLLGLDSYASAISADGSVVVGSFAGMGAARWTETEGWVSLGLPATTAFAVSGDGSVILIAGGSMRRGPYLWTRESGAVALPDLLIAQGFTELQSWSLMGVPDLSADGRTIVGSGTNPLGQREAWIATIPEPATVLLAAIAILGIAGWHIARRRQSAEPERH